MGFNLDELEKIKKKTSASTESKQMIANQIIKITPEINNIKLLTGQERRKSLANLSSKFSAQRRKALESGVASYSDPNWATPATIESWLQGLMFDNDSEIEKIEAIIDELKNPKRKDESSKSIDWIGILLIIVVAPFVYHKIGLWAAIIVGVVGLFSLGWKNRYDGPFKPS
ncbi:MAG: hypothetical protein KDD32_09405 [Bacteroidetes bacterium]|nr:hypothetical protein [Bacteroidota bacterium]